MTSGKLIKVGEWVVINTCLKGSSTSSESLKFVAIFRSKCAKFFKRWG